MEHNGFEYVDLGLPSGTLWATCNVGATIPTDVGLYFQYGNQIGYTPNDAKNNVLHFDEKNVKTDIDIANAYMGGNWRMPTKKECEELIDWAKNPLCMDSTVILRNDKTSHELIFPISGYLLGNRLVFNKSETWIMSSKMVSNKPMALVIKLYYGEKRCNLSTLMASNVCGNIVRGVLERNKA